MTAICLWCETGFEPRGKPQRFCSPPCRRAFDTACRKVGAAEIEAGRLQVFELKMALQQRACCPECGSALRGGPGAPETVACPDGALARFNRSR